MDDVARLPAGDRADLLRASAAHRALTPSIIEKDFWVCWSLKRLFTLQHLPAGLLFKGGTSLSKVFRAVERFSEDVDLSFDRRALGFGGENDPKAATSGKRKRPGLDALALKVRAVIRDQFLPQLVTAFSAALGDPAGASWALELAADDFDRQTVLFRYPLAVATARRGGPAYVLPAVRLESGARSDPWPATDADVMPYAAEDFPRLFKAPVARVHVLKAERTFGEKATILHAWYHAPSDKHFRDRQSRHYYDVVRLFENGPGKQAAENLGLLVEVAEHKDTFFPATWVRYADARPGTLRLVPPASRLAELRADYEKMRELIFGEPPPFQHLLHVLDEVERLVNTGHA